MNFLLVSVVFGDLVWHLGLVYASYNSFLDDNSKFFHSDSLNSPKTMKRPDPECLKQEVEEKRGRNSEKLIGSRSRFK